MFNNGKFVKFQLFTPFLYRPVINLICDVINKNNDKLQQIDSNKRSIGGENHIEPIREKSRDNDIRYSQTYSALYYQFL